MGKYDLDPFKKNLLVWSDCEIGFWVLGFKSNFQNKTCLEKNETEITFKSFSKQFYIRLQNLEKRFL